MFTLLCEFCCNDPMIALYPCPAFSVPMDTGHDEQSLGHPSTHVPVEDNFPSVLDEFVGWGACQECSDLIERIEIETLAQRAYSISLSKNAEIPHSLDYFRALFLFFFEHRTGPPQPDL